MGVLCGFMIASFPNTGRYSSLSTWQVYGGWGRSKADVFGGGIANKYHLLHDRWLLPMIDPCWTPEGWVSRVCKVAKLR